ncbi:MAG: (2Fe-2S)-binding protein [Candidatus Tectomicrobia bacterium]|uniref:(2Fe-2S)-binding protein n=1 Tax=Tectimicrobiota bacterium TaxID=2528274 RepID=A0A932M0P1_UNCTE|nr:(2Fe-2S)-binding protein [Candidatus Tectomicrobia bacterium]
MPKLTIDGKEITVPEGINIIQAAQHAGIEIPRYCFHQKLRVVATCRMCHVEVDKMPKLQAACSTVVREGMEVRTRTPAVVKSRQAVLEFFLLNHPLDCPICDKGGECPLQDYTLKYGPGHSRFVDEKLVKVKHLPIGPYIVFDAERCVLCTRCVRFCSEVVGTGELGVFNRGVRAEIRVHPGRELNNNYSGNVIDLCPVGALTSREYRFRARPWDIQKVDTICGLCSTGCNIRVSVRKLRPEVVRVEPRENEEVNGLWMCDMGRFEFDRDLKDGRLLTPRIKGRGGGEACSWEEAVLTCGRGLAEIISRYGPQAVGVIGSGRCTNEEAYLLKKFAREVLGTRHMDFRLREVQQEGRDFKEDQLLLRADRTPNSNGARAVGLVPAEGGLDIGGMREAIRTGALKGLVVVREDLSAEPLWGRGGLEGLEHLVVLDLLRTPTTETASIAFPLPWHLEMDGTFTNAQGRLQRLRKAVNPPSGVRSLGSVLQEVARAMGKELANLPFVDLWQEISASVPAYQGVTLAQIGDQGAPSRT